MTTERAKFFQEHGWLKIDNVLTREETEEARSELLKMVEEGIGAEKHNDRVKTHANPEYKRAFAAEVHEPARLSPFFKRLATSRKIGELMREAMGVPHIRLFRDLGLIKGNDGASSRGTGLHQDEVFYPLDRRGVATLWIALVDLPAHSGTMRFVDASNQWGPVGRESTPIDGWLAKHPEHASKLTLPPALSAGSATIHEGYTLHGSDANTWDQPRIALSLTYFRTDALYNEMPSRWTDGLGLEIDAPIEHELFPVVD